MSHVRIFYDGDSAAAGEQVYLDLVDLFGTQAVLQETPEAPANDRFGRGDVVLVVVGPNWARGAALRDLDDFLRRIGEAAINKRVSVIPVLVNGAVMPEADALPPELAEFSRGTPLVLRSAPYFDEDLNRLRHHVLMRRSYSGSGRTFGDVLRWGVVLVALGAAAVLVSQFLASPIFAQFLDQLDPSRASGYVDQAWIEYGEGNYQQALDHFKRALDLNVPGTEVYGGLGWSYYQLGDYDQALSNFSHLVALAPNSPASYLDRAWFHYELKDYDSASRDFVRVQQLDPELPASYYGLGLIADARQQVDNALRNFQRYLELEKNPDSFVVERVEQLKNLRSGG